MGRCLERAGLGPQGLLLRTLCGVLGKAANVEKSQVPHVLAVESCDPVCISGWSHLEDGFD